MNPTLGVYDFMQPKNFPLPVKQSQPSTSGRDFSNTCARSKAGPELQNANEIHTMHWREGPRGPHAQYQGRNANLDYRRSAKM